MASPFVQLNSGHSFPLIGFGTDKIYDQEAMNQAISAALKVGYRGFDTAKVYGNEGILSNALKDLLPQFNLTRQDIYITTKVLPFTDESDIRKLIDESLDLFEYIDLMMVHYPKTNEYANEAPENAEGREKTWKVLEDYCNQKKIRSIGVSNFEIKHLEEMKKYSNVMPAVNQVEFHPHFQRKELHDYCNKEGVFFQAFSSLGRFNPVLLEDETVKQIATKHDVPVTSVLLAFALCQNVGIIPKSQNPDRIASNLKAMEVKLDQKDLEDLKSLDINQNYIKRCTGWLVL
ncbi:unnamed protein product [Bursaphelenchus okinawaensis]|uniref:NADP-dependent oxidoreductase domain-containing protein n=1 Tax=Bursaphelenchus okinawaensis TaxID=465554 RepID=A0A811KXG4_9BILA|nr:unnamed protein product [Bursaphelenchus okinawaensis]CAG9113259.1 unnamed protein product [Bursaphelenchus okinawaensis]